MSQPPASVLQRRTNSPAYNGSPKSHTTRTLLTINTNTNTSPAVHAPPSPSQHGMASSEDPPSINKSSNKRSVDKTVSPKGRSNKHKIRHSRYADVRRSMSKDVNSTWVTDQQRRASLGTTLHQTYSASSSPNVSGFNENESNNGDRVHAFHKVAHSLLHGKPVDMSDSRRSSVSQQRASKLSMQEGKQPEKPDEKFDSVVVSSPPPHANGAVLPIRQIMIVFCCLSTCIGLSSLDSTIMGVASPAITQEFQEFQLFGWVISSYMLASAAFTPIYGKASDIFGRHACMQLALALFAGGSLLGALSNSMIVLIIARGIQGAGGAGLTSLTMVVIGDMLPPYEQGKYVPIQTTIQAVFSVLGPVVGGILVDTLTWRWIFWINLPLVGIASVIVFIYLRGIPIRQKRVHHWREIDWYGSCTVLVATCALIFGIISGGSMFAWSSLPIILSLTVSGLFYLLFIYTQHKAQYKALMPLHMFKNRNFSLAGTLFAFGGAVNYGLSTYLPSYFEIATHETAMLSGIRTLPLIGALVIATTLLGQVIARTGHYRSFPIIGGTFQCTGVIVLISMIAIHTEYYILAIALFVAGFGLGLSIPCNHIIIQNSIDAKDMASGITAGIFLRQLGGAIGTAVCSSILNNVYNNKLLSEYRHFQLALPLDDPINLSTHDILLLPEQQQLIYAESYVSGLQAMYYVVLGFTSIQLIGSLCFKNVVLKGSKADKAKKDEEIITNTDTAPTDLPHIIVDLPHIVVDLPNYEHEPSDHLVSVSPTSPTQHKRSHSIITRTISTQTPLLIADVPAPMNIQLYDASNHNTVCKSSPVADTRHVESTVDQLPSIDDSVTDELRPIPDTHQRGHHSRLDSQITRILNAEADVIVAAVMKDVSTPTNKSI